MFRSAAFIACAWLGSSACFTYQRTQEPAPVRSHVSLLLTTEGQLRLRDRIGLDQRELRGELLEDDGEMYLVAVPSTGPMQGVGGSQLHQRIDVPHADVLEVRTRAVSSPQTAALIAAGAAGVASVLAATVFADANPGSERPDVTGPQDQWVKRILGTSWIP